MVVCEDSMCVSCMACKAVCPSGAIKTRYDASKGMFLPYIDFGKCTKCGLCNRTCPNNGLDASSKRKKSLNRESVLASYAIYCKDKKVQWNSTSGGFVSLHRTSMGCFERTLAWLIEHYAGQFPTWMCAEQVRVLPISDKYTDYANEVSAALKKAGIRNTVDARSEKIGFKIREARIDRLPYMIVVGQKEQEEGLVSVRSRFKGDEGAKKLDDFIKDLLVEINTKEIKKIEVTEETK